MTAGTGTEGRYASEMGELWTGLARTLIRLESVAAEPTRLEDEGAVHALRRLQYALHVAGEHLYGVVPPADSAAAHAELAEALASARAATAAVVDAVDPWDEASVDRSLPEWRGALFRVRLARLRIAPEPARRQVEPADHRASVIRPLTAFLLALVGAVAVAAGATTGAWQLWGGGLLAVCISVLAYRP